MKKFGTSETARRAREAKESQRLGRMNEALEMARSGRSWSEIADGLGYRDVKALQRAVRRYCGDTKQVMPRIPLRRQGLSAEDAEELAVKLEELASWIRERLK